MLELTAFMIVKNEAATLPRCVESLRGVAERLVILDTGSEDGTPALLGMWAADPAAAGFTTVTTGRIAMTGFADARRAALARVETRWALWMDADEALSPPLRERLFAIKRDGDLDACAGWRLRRENHVLGRRMRGRNLSRDYPLRLFDTRRARLSDSLVHESLLLDDGAACGTLQEPLLHDAMPSWRAYLRKVDLYTTLDAAGGRYRFRWWHLIVTGPATFFRHYVQRTGFVDGWPGFVWAATSAYGAVLRDWKLLRRRLRRGV